MSFLITVAKKPHLVLEKVKNYHWKSVANVITLIVLYHFCKKLFRQQAFFSSSKTRRRSWSRKKVRLRLQPEKLGNTVFMTQSRRQYYRALFFTKVQSEPCTNMLKTEKQMTDNFCLKSNLLTVIINTFFYFRNFSNMDANYRITTVVSRI